MKHIFITNPASGSAERITLEQILKHYSNQTPLDYEIIYTTKPKDATEIAQRYHKEDDVTLYAVGGDGTIFEVVNGLNEEVPMGIIPMGTGNDTYRMVGERTSLTDIVVHTLEGKEVRVNYASANDHLFINGTSVGIDARINEHVCESLKKTILPKAILYAISAIMNIFNPQPFNARIEIDGVQKDGKYLLCAIMNGKYYGNGVAPNPTTDMQDDVLDIVLVKDAPVYKLIYLLPLYFSGKANELTKYAEILHGKHIKIAATTELCYQSDGETYHDTQVEIKLKKKKLILRVPSNSYLHD
ncbi:MAG: YegS/Rv2252/BmrU family lipid kinase [Erysipelotrichaceae bacterium]|nr:YegS/Rv2252/BmrU family lipid kinase [Erysipelotrichaceae bacterium]